MKMVINARERNEKFSSTRAVDLSIKSFSIGKSIKIILY